MQAYMCQRAKINLKQFNTRMGSDKSSVKYIVRECCAGQTQFQQLQDTFPCRRDRVTNLQSKDIWSLKLESS